MHFILYFIIAIFSYLLGSIPFGYLIAKAMKGIDIRDHGSGNIGATNVMRSIGKGPAVFVFFTDVLKGFIPVIAATSLIYPHSEVFIIGCGLLAILGHTMSVFLNFKGGKGVATSLGVIIGLNPIAALIAFAIWIIIVAITRYVSLASILAALSVPILFAFFKDPMIYIVVVSIMALYILIKHKQNIKRLIDGNEAKFGDKIL